MTNAWCQTDDTNFRGGNHMQTQTLRPDRHIQKNGRITIPQIRTLEIMPMADAEEERAWDQMAALINARQAASRG
jgi:hypothetical protein